MCCIRTAMREQHNPKTGSEISRMTPAAHLLDFVKRQARWVSFLILLATLAGYVAAVHRLFELTCHFTVQYLAVACACLVISLAFRDWRWATVALLSVAMNGAAVLPWYLEKAAPPPPGESQSLRLLLCNVYTANRQSAAVLELIHRERPDLIVLEEVNDRWMAGLEALGKSHPFSKWIPRSDNFGIAVLSRIALIDSRESLLDGQVPSILAGFNFAGQKISLLATHPLPPGSRSTFRSRNAQLRSLAMLAAQSKNPTIVLGDLNVTPWSPDYARLVRDSGLRDARRGHGILPTWPTMLPAMMIPLDHCLASPSLRVAAIRRGPHVGSDHLPLIVDLAVPIAAP